MEPTFYSSIWETEEKRFVRELVSEPDAAGIGDNCFLEV